MIRAYEREHSESAREEFRERVRTSIMTNNARVQSALKATPFQQLEALLKARMPGQKGSVFSREALRPGDGFNFTALYSALYRAEWSHASHPNIPADCTAFTAPLPGYVDVVALSELPPQLDVILRGDGTGDVVAYVDAEHLPARPATERCTIVLGADEHAERVFAVFPGDPNKATRIPATSLYGMPDTTVEHAMADGFVFAKVDF